MKKLFELTEIVRYHHVIEVEFENEQDFDDFAEGVGSSIDLGTYEGKDDVLHAFCEEFGGDKVNFVEDGSPEVGIE